jgi:NAD(P)H dehydrogenase (quinone)
VTNDVRETTKPSVLLILAHPDKRGFGGALADAYVESLGTHGCEVTALHLPALAFEATPPGRPPELEDDIVRAREAILRARHIVLVYPTWFGGMPARLKGFFERAFGNDFAFKFKPESMFPESYLCGRSADVLVTMDTPPWAYRWLLGAPGHKQVRHAILAPSGIKPIKIMSFGPLRASSDTQRKRWLEQTRARAAAIARTLKTTAGAVTA